MRVKSVSAGQICMYMCMYYICWRASLRNQTITSRMERLTSTLKSVLDKNHGLQTVVFALENLALHMKKFEDIRCLSHHLTPYEV